MDINVDQRSYNAPTVSQVTMIWEVGAESYNMFKTSIWCMVFLTSHNILEHTMIAIILYPIHYSFPYDDHEGNEGVGPNIG